MSNPPQQILLAALFVPILGFGACSNHAAPPEVPPATSEAVAPTTVSQTPGGYHIQAFGRTHATFTVPTLDRQAPTVTIQQARDGWQRVSMVWNPTSSFAQDQLAVRLRLSQTGDFHWLPHLAPLPGYVISQDAFRSPALVSANGSDIIAVVPDLDLVGQDPEKPWFLDLDLPSRSMWVGLSKLVRPVEVLWQTTSGMTFQPGPVELAFYVHVFRDTTAVRNPFGPVRRFLWDEFADESFRGARGNPALDHYAGLAHSWAEGPWRDRFWQEFELNGESAGGPLMLVDASWSPSNTSGAWVQREQPGIWNQAWFSSMRCALGMHQRGARLGDPGLVQRARQVLALTLAAPQQNGLFPTVFESADPVRISEGRGLEVDWTTGRWTNSNRVPTELGITQDHYHVLDMSWTALWLARWYDEVEQDPRILQFVKAYADRLVALQTPLGYFPAWLHPQTQAPAGILTNSVESAASAWFLLEFARIHPDPRYVPAAEAALSAMLSGPVGVGRWEDFETYWSNNNIGRFTNVGIRFLRNGVFKQNTLGMYWVAGACLEAYRTTGSATYRDWGARVVDELCMWQQVWRPPFMYVPTLGGFGVMNADAEWNDARQSLCAELFLDWSRELDDDQLWDRGVAALRASFAMMYTASNPEAERQWEARYPFFSVLDVGFTMENYAHYEVPGPNGEGMGDFAIWTWGAGAAAQSWERIRSRFGSAQLEPTSARSRVVDSLTLRRDNGGWYVDDLADEPRWVRVQYPNGRAETVWLDGSARLATDAAGR